MLKLVPRARFGGDVPVEHFELVLDGQKVRDCPAGGGLTLDTEAIADGPHELRVVAMSHGPLIAQGEKIILFTSANHDRTIEVTCQPAENRGFR